MTLIPSRLSCFHGALRRRGPNRWAWPDDSDEPRVHEIATALWNVPQRPFSDAVEVALAHAQAYDPLAWVIAGCKEGRYDVEVSSWFPGAQRQAAAAGEAADGGARVASRQAVMVAVVPAAEWKPWRALCPVVALWNTADELALFARAQELGWKR